MEEFGSMKISMSSEANMHPLRRKDHSALLDAPSFFKGFFFNRVPQ